MGTQRVNRLVSHNQIVRLYSRFTSLDKSSNGVLSREDFLRIPELAINPLGDRIVHAFFQESNDETVNFRQFMRVLARFRPTKSNQTKNKLNSREEKLKFAFKMYDLDGDDKISRDELLAVLHMMVGDNITEEQLGSIADKTISEADINGDNQISFDEFVTVARDFSTKSCTEIYNVLPRKSDTSLICPITYCYVPVDQSHTDIYHDGSITDRYIRDCTRSTRTLSGDIDATITSMQVWNTGSDTITYTGYIGLP
ncbi:Calcineurin B homologous protein 1 [Mizuhopecten yessoensis]|uniref:Calcineurin B homologous protein 1 n=1 Tax=Mizuhopecten yessoensis TaxID=6573 RepID=A0A210PM78_MIZYE|nr:Calcineurin B homologous protein 1 [Mizuhopecten yessoensis]